MIDIRLGDCRDLLKTIPDGSVDCIITDPPYPEIDRDYGRMTEAEWHAMMDVVVPESRRVLKPTGSAVFILQPNSRKVGSMRSWLWKFLAKWSEEWNQVQDAWWWNYTMLPNGGSTTKGMLRSSVKACVWLGSADCYRMQANVLWGESDRNKAELVGARWEEKRQPSGNSDNRARMYAAAKRRGGVTPFNLIPCGRSGAAEGGVSGHGSTTPQDVTDWWTRYICPPGGTILDPFMGSGTTGLSAIKYGCSYFGFDHITSYFDISRARLDAAIAELPLFAADR